MFLWSTKKNIITFWLKKMPYLKLCWLLYDDRFIDYINSTLVNQGSHCYKKVTINGGSTVDGLDRG